VGCRRDQRKAKGGKDNNRILFKIVSKASFKNITCSGVIPQHYNFETSHMSLSMIRNEHRH
jgi:hypothetical protein